MSETIANFTGVCKWVSGIKLVIQLDKMSE